MNTTAAVPTPSLQNDAVWLFFVWLVEFNVAKHYSPHSLGVLVLTLLALLRTTHLAAAEQ